MPAANTVSESTGLTAICKISGLAELISGGCYRPGDTAIDACHYVERIVDVVQNVDIVGVRNRIEQVARRVGVNLGKRNAPILRS